MYQKSSQLLMLLAILILGACSASQQSSTSSNYRPTLANSTTFVLTEISTDQSYGYSQKNPVKVGGAQESEGPSNERRFLNALAGPNGEPISYERQGSCCQFKTPNGIMGAGMLDIYELRWEGQKEPVILYVNMYDYDVLKAPQGLTLRKVI